jgi:ribosomal protein S12 methylthiotransferase accessory factor
MAGVGVREQRVASPAPILFRGIDHRARKGFMGATHRTCPPEETMERIRPLLPVAGITRMADITGLDRIGVPTVLSMRPNAPTLANASGKGFTRAAAMVSAAMEGIELHFAENLAFSDSADGYGSGSDSADGYGSGLIATHRELERSGLACPIEQLPLTLYSTFSVDAPEDWTIGFDLIGQRPMAVPSACVGMRSGYFRDRSRFSFQVGSNGLASGNVFLEAVCSGLAEVIERDAVTCMKLRSAGHLELERPVDVTAAGYDSVSALIEQLRRARITPIVFDCTADTAVPTYVAYILDDLEPDTGMYRGYGAHLHPEVAIVRALTEAVQGRAVYIAGSRDDLLSLEHRRMRRTGMIRALDTMRHADTPPVSTQPSAAGATFEEDCTTMLARIRAVGIEHAVVVELSPPDLPVSVVRVVTPGLEGYSSFSHYGPGPRGRAAQREGMPDGPALQGTSRVPSVNARSGG